MGAEPKGLREGYVLAVVCSVQWWPFHISAGVGSLLEACGTKLKPTASQSDRMMQDT